MYLGIDLGTSSVKTVLIGAEGDLIGDATSPIPTLRPAPLFSEQDPEDWWRATTATVLDLGRRHDLKRVRAIGLSGQMHGAVLLDSGDRVLRPAILWNDGRCQDECVALDALARRETGNLAMPGFTAPKLPWVRRHEPDLFDRTKLVLLPKDWLRLRMTGEAITDMSDAAGTLWLDVAHRRWSDAMLAATHLTRGHMPALVEGTDRAGTLRQAVAEAWGLTAGIPIAGGAGDQAAGAVAIGCIAPGNSFVSLGTSAILFVADAGFLPDPDRTVHAFCHALPATWHRMAASLTGASALGWVTRATGAEDEVALLAEMELSRNDPPLFLPHLTGERTPHNDPLATAAFTGLRIDHGRGDLGRAVLEGVGFVVAEGLGLLAERGAPVGSITAISGGSRSAAWMRILAAATNTPIETVAGSEVGSALGAARLAWIARGDATIEQACTRPPVTACHEPDPDLRAALAPRQAVWGRLYDALRSVRVPVASTAATPP